jgi:hypothetical protein
MTDSLLFAYVLDGGFRGFFIYGMKKASFANSIRFLTLAISGGWGGWSHG